MLWEAYVSQAFFSSFWKPHTLKHWVFHLRRNACPAPGHLWLRDLSVTHSLSLGSLSLNHLIKSYSLLNCHPSAIPFLRISCSPSFGGKFRMSKLLLRFILIQRQPMAVTCQCRRKIQCLRIFFFTRENFYFIWFYHPQSAKVVCYGTGATGEKGASINRL